MNLRPLFDRGLVRPIKPEEMTKGGIIITDNAKERSASGVVVARGPDALEHIADGDVVMYGKFSGFEVGVEKLQEIAGGELVSETETLVVLRMQEIMLVKTAPTQSSPVEVPDAPEDHRSA